MKYRKIAALLVMGGALAGAGEGAKDIVDTAKDNGSFKTLVAAVRAADLEGTLRGKGPFTVFAPNDAAFAKVPAATLDSLLQDKKALAGVLTYHVVPGKLSAKDVAKASWLETAQGQSLRVVAKDGAVTIDGAKVIAADIETSNGILHVIDAVVQPRKDLVDTAVDAGFTTLAAALKAADLVEALRGTGPFTVFAPTDDAFAALPAGALDGLLRNVPALKSVLTFHVIPGRVLSTDLGEGTMKVKTLQGSEVTVVKGKDGSVTINGARVTAADVLAGNGVVHVIDRVIMPGQ